MKYRMKDSIWAFSFHDLREAVNSYSSPPFELNKTTKKKKAQIVFWRRRKLCKHKSSALFSVVVKKGFIFECAFNIRFCSKLYTLKTPKYRYKGISTFYESIFNS